MAGEIQRDPKFRNTLCVILAYTQVLSQPLGDYVVKKLDDYFKKVKKHLKGGKLTETLPHDPEKITTKFKHEQNATTIKNLNIFAEGYVGQV